MGKWRYVFVNCFEFKGLISFMMEFLNQCQYGRDASVFWGILLQNNDNSAEYKRYILHCSNLQFNCSDVRKLGYWMSPTTIFCDTSLIGEESWIRVGTENWIWAFHIGIVLDWNNLYLCY